MGEVGASVRIEASLADVWQVCFDPRTWPSWVDGFSSLVERDEQWPQAGGRIVWRSGPTGRGTVREVVLTHEPRRLHRVRFSDDHTEGELASSFEVRGEGVEATMRMAYSLTQAQLPVVGAVTDLLFVRGQMRRVLERTLHGLRLEARDLTGSL